MLFEDANGAQAQPQAEQAELIMAPHPIRSPIDPPRQNSHFRKNSCFVNNMAPKLQQEDFPQESFSLPCDGLHLRPFSLTPPLSEEATRFPHLVNIVDYDWALTWVRC